MFRKDRMGRRGGGVCVIIHQGNYTSLCRSYRRKQIAMRQYRCPNIKQNNEKIHNAITEVSKGDCIIMGYFKWDTLQSTGVEYQTFL